MLLAQEYAPDLSQYDLEQLKKSFTRGGAQILSGFADLGNNFITPQQIVAEPFAQKMGVSLLNRRPDEEVFGTTDYLTKQGIIPERQEGALNTGVEFGTSLLNPSFVPKSMLGLAGIMMGQKSKLFNKRGGDVDRFLEMEKEGFQSSSNPEAPYTKTQAWEKSGTARNPFDKKLRQELDDSQSFLDMDKVPKFNAEQLEKYNAYKLGYKDKSILPSWMQKISKNQYKDYMNMKIMKDMAQQNAKPLRDSFHYKDLYEAYPQLDKDTKITSYPMIGERKTGGYFDPNTNTVFINTNTFKSVDPKDIVLHELQHKVQYLEGMDTGAPSELSYTQVLKAINRVKKENPDNEKIISLVDDVYDKFTDQKKGDFYTQVGNPYWTKGGEIEARIVGRRRDMPAVERRLVYPYRFNRTMQMARPEQNLQMDVPPAYGWSSADTGMFDPLTKSDSYIRSTAGKPDPRLGKRFETEDLGGLITPEIAKAKDIEGASLVFKPSDMTSRNQKIISISDELIESQYRKTTEGGNDFARDAKNIKEDKFYGSTEGKVDNDTFRMIQAYRENIAQGGTGDIGFTPSTMSMYSENFSTMPFENIYPFFVKKGNKAFTDAFDADIRSGKGITGDGFPEFKGVMTPEGYQQATNNPSLRKAIMERIQGNKTIQQELGMNAEDLSNALRSERLRGVPKDHAGDTIVMMDKKLLQKASDMLADANVTHMRRSQLSKEQNEVLDKVLKMFKKPMGKSHRTYNTANTGSSGKVISLDMSAPVMNFYGDDAMDKMLRGQIQYGTDPNKAPKSLLGNKGALDQALFNFYSGHRNTGLFLSPDRVKEIDRMKKSGLFDMKGLL